MPTSSFYESFLHSASPLNAQLLAVLIPIPDQKLTTWSDNTAGSIEDFPVILKGYQVLLFIVPGTVHIPRMEGKRGKYQVGSSMSALAPYWYPVPLCYDVSNPLPHFKEPSVLIYPFDVT